MNKNYLLLEDLGAVAIWTKNQEAGRIYFRVEYLDGKKGFGDWLCVDPSDPEHEPCEAISSYLMRWLRGEFESTCWSVISEDEAMLMLGK